MKRLLFYCVVLIITFSQFGCNRLADDRNRNSLYMQYLVQSKNHNALFVNIAYTEKAEIGYVEQYYRLDLQNYNTETISYLKGRQLNLLKSKYKGYFCLWVGVFLLDIGTLLSYIQSQTILQK